MVPAPYRGPGHFDSPFIEYSFIHFHIQTADRYELKSHDPVYTNGIGLGRPPGCTHVTFVDHTTTPASQHASQSNSTSTSESGPVDLPSRTLLRAHAALAGVLHRSGAVDVFRVLRYAHDYGCSQSVYPASTGSAFWRSVVEYGGPEVCLEVGLWEAAQADSEVLDSDWGGTRT